MTTKTLIANKPKGVAVNAMFTPVAKRYDLMNHILSFGADFYWRRCLVAAVKAQQPKRVVDLATGSGDVAFALKRELGDDVAITGLDFCQAMLDESKRKRSKNKAFKDISFSWGDCLDLPLEDNSIDVLTISFGLRNLEDRHKGLMEMKRVLKPGGKLFVLEFSQPYRWFNPLYKLYLKTFLPMIAHLFTGNKQAYEYLSGSIEHFPSRERIEGELDQAGFKTVPALPLTFGVVAMHAGVA
tara:strand:+ start:23592 stop:24314 length:723 start_codon:yes stop_codon:yes gene_type:complete